MPARPTPPLIEPDDNADSTLSDAVQTPQIPLTYSNVINNRRLCPCSMKDRSTAAPPHTAILISLIEGFDKKGSQLADVIAPVAVFDSAYR